MAGILIAGTNSDAGKSLVVTGLCRALVRRGLRIAPFKAQNMSNNSMVCADGSEIGRAQYLQALAAQIEPDSVHNPVLLKPGSDRRAHVILRGHPAGELAAGQYATGRRHLAEAAFNAYTELAAEYDLVVCEGAGSPAEINLRAGDYVNMGLARQFNLPVAVVGDIDRGGILAAFVGTHALLDPADQALLKAFIVNKFRGDLAVLTPGLDLVTERTGVPFAGVLPWLPGMWIDSEDSLSIGRWRQSNNAPTQLNIAVIAFPHISNATDLDALAAEPGTSVQLTSDPDLCMNADLLVLPGSRATISDLNWLGNSGLVEVIQSRAKTQRPILGICGGYQMLNLQIEDQVESTTGTVPGLGLLPGTVQFKTEKTLGRPSATWKGTPVSGYEIHHGIVHDDGSFPGGATKDSVWGTIWHGIFECDQFRRAWLTQIAAQAKSSFQVATQSPGFTAQREAMINATADAVETYLDLDFLLALTKEN